jgi:hypothetical protein
MVVLGFSALDASSVLGANHGSLVCLYHRFICKPWVQNRPGHQPVIIQTIDPVPPTVPTRIDTRIYGCAKVECTICLNHLPIQFVESIWLKCLVMQIMALCCFPFQKKTLEVLPNLVQKKKKKQTYVLLILAKCVFATTKF